MEKRLQPDRLYYETHMIVLGFVEVIIYFFLLPLCVFIIGSDDGLSPEVPNEILDEFKNFWSA